MAPTKLDLFLNGNPNGKTEKDKKGRQVTDSGKPFTHWSFDNREKWWIDPDDMEEFCKLYCADLRHGVGRYLTEKQTAVGMLRVDLDFKYEGELPEHKHTREQVSEFVDAYMQEVKKYVEVPPHANVYVLEKEYPTYDSIKKISASGIHVQVPDIKTRAGVEQAIRRTLVRRMEEFFPDLGLTKSWEDVYDKQPLSHTNNWPLLGSKKKDGLPYEIKYILDWDSATGALTVNDEVPAMSPELVARMSVRSTAEQETPMTEHGKENIRIAAEREVVVISGGRAVTPARGRQATRAEPAHGSRSASPGRIIIPPLTEELRNYYVSHLKNLASTRYSEYANWIEVGICLKNLHPEMEDAWHDFSAQAGDGVYNPRETMNKWNSFTYRADGAKLGIGSLRRWSAMDNFDGYKRVEEENVDRLIEKSAETATENDVARVIHAKYRDEFKCAKYGANAWFRYTGHIWKETDRGIGLQIRLSKEIADMYLDKEEAEVNKIRAIGQCDHKEASPDCQCCGFEKAKKTYSNIRLKLKKTSFKRNVMDECRELFLDEELASKLDENKSLIAFNNGVFDTLGSDEIDKEGKYVRPWFRDGKPEDYMSFCTNIDFATEKEYYQFDCWLELSSFLKSILPDRTVRDYFLKHLSTCLSGGNEAQKFHILTGSGSNGKSMLMNLMATAMGDYCCKAPISLLTQQRNKSAAAAPELVRMKGRRFVTMQEPDEQVPLNTGLMKELASCEKITARDLYAGSKQMIDFDIQARFHLACNEKPKVNTTDGGTWRRLVVIDFPMKFVHDPKAPNELPIDETIVQKVVSEEWSACFMAYLVHLYKELRKEGKLTPPAKVLEYTNEYKEDSDIIARFMREYFHPIVEAGDGPEPVVKNQITSTFQDWKRSNELTGRASTDELIKRVVSVYGKYPRNGWTAFQFGSA